MIDHVHLSDPSEEGHRSYRPRRELHWQDRPQRGKLGSCLVNFVFSNLRRPLLSPLH